MAQNKVAQFAGGQDVFGDNGECYCYEAPIAGGHVVRPFFNYGGEEGLGPPLYVPNVHAEAPVKVYSDKALALRKEIAELESRRSGLRAEAARAEEDARQIKDRLREIDALRYVDDILSGCITHFFAVADYGKARVLTRDEFISENDNRHDQGFKLLTLFGKTKGDLRWRLNQYSDGSGSYQETGYPFPSEEEAMTFAKEFTARKLLDPEVLGSEYRLANWIASAIDLGVEVPADLVARNRERKLERLRTAAENKRQEWEGANAALREAEAVTAPEPTREEG